MLGGPAAGDAPAAYTQGNGQLRVVHAWSGVANADISVDGARVWSGLSYGDDTGYLVVAAGNHSIALAPVGNPPGALRETPVTLAAGQAVTVLFAETALGALVLDDVGLAPVGGPSLVRLVHAAPSPAPLMLAQEGGPTLVGPLGAGEASAYVETGAGAMTLLLRAPDTATELGRIAGAVLVPDRAYTFVVIEAPGGDPPFRLLPFADSQGVGLSG